jgi:hypothetical protein
VCKVDIPLDPAPRAVHGLATARAKRRLFAAYALIVLHINIPRHAAPAAPERTLGARGGKGGPGFAARGAHFADKVDIPADPAPGAVNGLATARAKRRHLAAPAPFTLHINIPRHAAPAAPERALGARGGKGGPGFAARGAHFADQVDIPLDPATRAVHFLATWRAKRRLLAAPAHFVLHIHIPGHTTPAAPDRLLGARAGERGAFFTAHRALGHVFFLFSFFSSACNFSPPIFTQYLYICLFSFSLIIKNYNLRAPCAS